MVLLKCLILLIILLESVLYSTHVPQVIRSILFAGTDWLALRPELPRVICLLPSKGKQMAFCSSNQFLTVYMYRYLFCPLIVIIEPIWHVQATKVVGCLHQLQWIIKWQCIIIEAFITIKIYNFLWFTFSAP